MHRYSGFWFIILAILISGISPVHAGTMECISLSSNGTPANTGGACPSTSADGRFVAFISFSTNLVSGVTSRPRQIYVRDRRTGTMGCVSVAPDDTQGDDGSYTPSISADGRFVAFESFSTNLVPGVSNGYRQLFVRCIRSPKPLAGLSSSGGIWRTTDLENWAGVPGQLSNMALGISKVTECTA